MGVTYDTGALIAADRGERRIWARHRALLALREIPTVPAPVVAQSWRGGSRQALLYARLERAVDDALREAVGPDEAHVLESQLLSRYRPPFNMPPAQALLLALRHLRRANERLWRWSSPAC